MILIQLIIFSKLCLHFYQIIFLTIIYYSAALPTAYFNRNSHHTSTPKLSLADSAEWTEYHVRDPEGPGTYSFGYDVEDSQTGNVQFRTEERRPNGTVTGSYGYVTPEGYVHVVHYIADHLGYRTKIEDSRRVISSNENYKTLDITKENISPQMFAALQSLGNYNKFKKEDQRVRPIDRTNSNSPNIVPILDSSKNNKVYKVYFVPPSN